MQPGRYEMPLRLRPPTRTGRCRFAASTAFGVAALLTVVSLVGLAFPGLYARETDAWRAQAYAQDIVTSVVVVPWLVISAIWTLRGSRRGAMLLASALVYTAYAFAIYTFAVHFNNLFLVYCAGLGLSVFALAGLAPGFFAAEARVQLDRHAPCRLAGGWMMASAVVFAVLWLCEIVPAMIFGEPPSNLANGPITNPLHVLDLSLALPFVFVSGLLLWRRRESGYVLGTVWMGFCVLMNLNIGYLVITQWWHERAGDPALVYGFAVLISVSTVLYVLLLRSVRPRAA
ncbi:MAG: hypothetical protein H0T79_21390 [Deltaproteobacteria bacterium]|nr:hypothetical protein [Deltaproteobacteria bacterium]